MTEQIVLIVTGNTYHTHSDCEYVRGKQGQMIRRGHAESQGFKLCSRCAKLDRKESAS